MNIVYNIEGDKYYKKYKKVRRIRNVVMVFFCWLVVFFKGRLILIEVMVGLKKNSYI